MKTPLSAVAPWLLVPLLWLAPADKTEAPQKKPIPKEVQAVLDEIDAPSIQGPDDDQRLFETFEPDKMPGYTADGADSDLRKEVRKARVLLWAVSIAAPPMSLADEVAAVRKDLKINLTVLRQGYRKPANEAQFKSQVFADEKQAAELMSALQDALDDLKKIGEQGRNKETKRWQANYDFTLARLQNLLVFLYEYESMLGSMRKEFPPLAPGQNGWKLVPRDALQGDPDGKKLARESAMLLEKLVADIPGTPWEILAKHELKIPLGLEWQGFKGE